MVGIISWKSRIWEDGFSQVSGNYDMFFASENGPNSYRDDNEPVIYDIGKLSSFSQIDSENTQGAHLICMHKRKNNVT